MHKIFVPIDGSENAARASDYALKLAKENAPSCDCSSGTGEVWRTFGVHHQRKNGATARRTDDRQESE
mgnify:CR=1 FL=1